MYAIFRSGGKQYKVKAGDLVRVEKIQQDLGAEFDLTEILAIGGDKTFVGAPVLDNAKVRVVVTHQAKAPKVIVFKKKRRQGYRRMQGHRQLYTELFIKEITSPEGDVSAAETSPKVYDPNKKAERAAKLAEAAAAEGSTAKKTTKSAAKKKTATKKVTKKKVTKKKVTKKTGKKVAKKTTAKKKSSGKKKATKK